MVPKDIETWDNTKWSKITYGRPSSGGAVGVVFVWIYPNHRDGYGNPSSADFVIKPVQGTGAPTKFAERMLKHVAGAASPKSKPIPRRSFSGSGLMMMLKTFRDTEKDPAIKNRWREIYVQYDRAETFLIQETQSGLAELGDVVRERGGLVSFLSNHALLRNLGKLFAADALIGNGDRLDKINTGNIMFKADGTIAAIDTAAILTNYKAIFDENRGAFRNFERDLNGVSKEDRLKDAYVRQFVHKSGDQIPSKFHKERMGMFEAGRIASPVALPTSFRMSTLFDIRKWWDEDFRHHLSTAHFKDTDGQIKPVIPPRDPALWESAFREFEKGFKEGMKEVDSQLSGLNWLKLKFKYRDYVKRFGGDPNLDWNNFKLRRRYFKLLKKGTTIEEALADVQEFAKKSMPGL